MRLISLGFSLMFSCLAFATEFKVDADNSKVKWFGSKVVGGSHNGNIKVQSGVLNWEKGKLNSANLTIDMSSITNNDISVEKFRNKLVGHLNSDDFFSVKKFKTASFQTKKVQHVKDDSYMLTGDLTIKGKTKAVKFLAKVAEKNKVLIGEGQIKFDRTDFDVRYGSGKFFDDLGDKMISDEVKIDFQLVTKK